MSLVCDSGVFRCVPIRNVFPSSRMFHNRSSVLALSSPSVSCLPHRSTGECFRDSVHVCVCGGGGGGGGGRGGN